MKTTSETVPEAATPAPWFTPNRFGFFLGLFILAFFLPVILGTNSFFYRDFGIWAYPDAVYHRDCFWQGELPLWNPYNNCGLPFLAQWNTLTLYPLSLIYLIFPLPWSLNLFCLFHLWLAGMGMFLLSWRWTGNRFAAGAAGTAYALNGLTLHSVMWPNNIAALGWLPLVILFAERARQLGGRWILFGALIGATQMLAGAPEIILLTWLVVIVFSVADLATRKYRAPALIGRLGCLVGGVTLLCAIQLLPFLELAAVSQRSAGFGDSTWSMPAWGWANYLVPLFHQSKSVVGVYSQDDQQWTSSYYAGIGVLALAITAVFRVRDLRARVLAGLGFVAILMAMGEHSPLYRSLRDVLPQLGFFRFPIKFVVLATFAIPALAAWTITVFHSNPDQRANRRALLFVWLIMLTSLAGLMWTAWHSPVVNEDPTVTHASALSRAAFLLLIPGLLVVRTRLSQPGHGWRVEGAILILIALDAVSHAPRQNPTISAAALKPNAAISSGMPQLGEGRVMLTHKMREFMDHAATANLVQYYLGQRTAQFANCNLIDRVPKTDGFYSLYLREETQIQALFRDSTNPRPDGLIDFLGVTRISSDTNIFEWTARATALPLITAGQRQVVANAAATLAALGNPGFDGKEVVYLPEGTLLKITNRANARVEATHFSSHRIEAKVELDVGGPVVASQTFAPGWRGYLDGRAVPILRANHAFQAIDVPAGRHSLALVYQDRSFHWGLIVSGLTAVACAAACRHPSRKAGANGKIA